MKLKRLERIGKFIHKYGVRHGVKLYLCLKLNKVSKLRVPGIKEPIFLRRDLTDKAIFDQIFLLDDYNITLPYPPKLIIDGGANIGLFTMLMKNKFPDATIICIEPDKENYEILKRNVSLYSNVKLINAGLWSKDTTLKVYDKYNEGKSAMIVEEDTNGNIEAISIDTLMLKYSIERIDVLKLDIETSEAELFASNYEHWLPKIKTIIIELHDWMKGNCSRTFFEAINRCFKKYQYSHCGENTVIINEDI